MNDMIYNLRKSSYPFSIADNSDQLCSNIHKPSLKVLGLGGGGSNAINRMIELGLSGEERPGSPEVGILVLCLIHSSANKLHPRK